MFTAKVVGAVWATRKIPILKDKRLLLVQPMDPMTGKTSGKVQMAAAGVIDAGIGDTVLIIDEGSSAKDHFKTPPSSIRCFVFAIVDQVHSQGETVNYT